MRSLDFEFLNSSPAGQVMPYQEPKDTTPNNGNRKVDRGTLVSWLFLIGSLMFVLDAVLENIKGVSFSSLLHLFASIFFTVGSILFIPDNSQQ